MLARLVSLRCVPVGMRRPRARDSYECKYICCCVILALLCLLLSPVLAFLYHLFPSSFVRRSLSSSSVCLLFPVCWPVPYVPCSGYGLVPVLSISCSISFHACSIQISFFVLWLSILLKFMVAIARSAVACGAGTAMPALSGG